MKGFKSTFVANELYSYIKFHRDLWVLDSVHCLESYRTPKNTTFRKLDLFPSSGEDLQWLGLVVSKGPNRLGISRPLTWGRKQIRFLKSSMMDRVLKPTNPDCHTPSSESFRIYSSNTTIILLAEKNGSDKHDASTALFPFQELKLTSKYCVIWKLQTC
jgi:hypothetical protein